MRIPLVQHIPIKHALIFASLILALQVIESTSMAFSALCFAFILISTFAFNAAGGLIYPTGSFIFFNATLTALIGISYKALLAEPGQSNLRSPVQTMLVYCGGMIAAGFVAGLTRRLAPRKGLLVGMTFGESMKHAAIGAFLLGAAVQLATLGGTEKGSFLAAARQINQFTALAIVLATFYESKKTGGRKSSNWIVCTATSWMFFFGILSTSKQMILTGPVTWLGAAAIAGHNFTRKQIFGVILAAVVFQMYLAPFSQVARNYKDENWSFSNDVQNAWRFLSDPQGTRESYQTQGIEIGDANGTKPHLFDEPQGFWDRINIVAMDDALVNFTEQESYEGLLPTYAAFFNLIPHFLWKDKPLLFTGNRYARQMGVISDENEETGVSFSPAADAYHQVGWYGVFLLYPAVLFLLFMVMDTLSGDIRTSPWGILFCIVCAHNAPEAMIEGQIYTAIYVAFGVVFAALASKYILPIIGRVLPTAGQTRLLKTSFQPAVLSHPRVAPAAAPAVSAPASGTAER